MKRRLTQIKRRFSQIKFLICDHMCVRLGEPSARRAICVYMRSKVVLTVSLSIICLLTQNAMAEYKQKEARNVPQQKVLNTGNNGIVSNKSAKTPVVVTSGNNGNNVNKLLEQKLPVIDVKLYVQPKNKFSDVYESLPSKADDSEEIDPILKKNVSEEKMSSEYNIKIKKTLIGDEFNWADKKEKK